MSNIHWTFSYERRFRIALNLHAISAITTELEAERKGREQLDDALVGLLRIYVEALSAQLVDDLHEQSKWPF